MPMHVYDHGPATLAHLKRENSHLRELNEKMREALKACAADHDDSGCFRQSTGDKVRALLKETEQQT